MLADDTGVCFIPRARAEVVLELAQKRSAGEDEKCRLIDEGVGVADFPRKLDAAGCAVQPVLLTRYCRGNPRFNRRFFPWWFALYH